MAKILIVEDEPRMRRLLEISLSEDGEKLKLDTRGADQPALLSHEGSA